MDTTADIDSCGRCRRALGEGVYFELRAPGGVSARCLRCALTHHPLLRRSLVVGLVIGSVLVALNQGGVLVSGDLARGLAWKVPLTYVVPFFVSAWGALSNAHRRM